MLIWLDNDSLKNPNIFLLILSLKTLEEFVQYKLGAKIVNVTELQEVEVESRLGNALRQNVPRSVGE